MRHSPDIEKDNRAHTDILGVESPHNEAVGTQLRHLRQTTGITQHDLAREAGLSVDHIGKIERGTTSPTVEALARIAGGLGVSVKSLLDCITAGIKMTLQLSVHPTERIIRFL